MSAAGGGFVRRFTGCALALGTAGIVALLPAAPASAAAGCRIGPGGSIKHVIIIQFDNVHLERDNPNVPSDIQQIPALEDFVTHNGTLLSNDHTVLISHTSKRDHQHGNGPVPGSGRHRRREYLPVSRPEADWDPQHECQLHERAGYERRLAIHLLDRPDQRRRSAVHDDPRRRDSRQPAGNQHPGSVGRLYARRLRLRGGRLGEHGVRERHLGREQCVRSGLVAVRSR